MEGSFVNEYTGMLDAPFSVRTLLVVSVAELLMLPPDMSMVQAVSALRIVVAARVVFDKATPPMLLFAVAGPRNLPVDESEISVLISTVHADSELRTLLATNTPLLSVTPPIRLLVVLGPKNRPLDVATIDTSVLMSTVQSDVPLRNVVAASVVLLSVTPPIWLLVVAVEPVMVPP